MPLPESVAAGQEVAVDVAIIGAGVAGLVAALDLLDAAPRATVAVLDKGAMGSAGSTPLAQGGIAAAVGRDDSPQAHAEDTLRAGDGLGDARAVAVMAAETPARVIDLERRGARFDRGPDGQWLLALEGGQRLPRSVRAADATGAEIFRALREAALTRTREPQARLIRLQGSAVDLTISPGGAASGVWVLLDEVEAPLAGPVQTGGLALVRARAVLLASGGCGGLYAATTNRDGATADGVALAWRAGAALIDLEFVQFHPTGLKAVPRDGESPHWRFLLTEALRGAGATLLDAQGRRFMADRHPDAELAPRHIVTKGILDQPGGAWLDATGIARAQLEEEFPTVLAGARRFGFDLAREPVPVEPCEHYQIGGVATDLDARTSIPGLWAAGEVACSGVHGANRMAGNSLAQAAVFGHRSAFDIVRALGEQPFAELHRRWSEGQAGGQAAPAGGRSRLGDVHAEPALAPAADPGDAQVRRERLRIAMSAGAGPIRTGDGLTAAAVTLDEVDPGGVRPATRAGLELANAVAVGRLMVGSALVRNESRGTHWRDDAPGHSPYWQGRRLRVARFLSLEGQLD